MTITANTTYDVFVSHAISDSDVAREIAESLQAAGLATFHAGAVRQGDDIGDAIWDALAESRALIAIISPDLPLQAMGTVEIGAAAAWSKPIYVVVNGSLTTKLPSVLRSYPIYPLSRFDEVIHAIQTGFDALTIDERDALADVYQNVGVPADQLSQSPRALRDLAKAFGKRTHKQFSGERLLSEILRLRKSGRLPRLTVKTP